MSRIDYDRDIQFMALHEPNSVSDQQLKKIAQLIYQTDEYIYPAMFGCLDNAVKLIPAIFRDGRDYMFSFDNMHVASIGESIVAVLLARVGKMAWSGEILREIAASLKIEVPDTLVSVQEEYLDERYVEESTDDTISIINVCTDSAYRGHGIAKRLLRHFIDENRDAKMELCVIKGNDSAVNLYRGLGFKETREYLGYSATSEKPCCLEMKRNP